MAEEQCVEPLATSFTDKDADQDHFRLLDLPSKLVIRVIKHAVVFSSKEKPLRVLSNPELVHHHRTENEEQSAEQPAIMRTNRTFRHEGLKLFYSQNVFLADTSVVGREQLRQWLTAIGEQNHEAIEHLFVEWMCDQMASMVISCDKQLVVPGDHSVVRAGQFWGEAAFLHCGMKQASGDEVVYYYRDEGGKLVLDSVDGNVRYQISFRDMSGDLGHWRPVRDYLDFDITFRGNIDFHDADFWVAEAET